MKTLKQASILLITLLFSINSQAQLWGKTIKGNGNMTTIKKSTDDYDVIKCAGWMDFVLEKGTEGTITLEGEENLLEYISVESNGNTLHIKTEKNLNLKPSWNKTIVITIPFESINKVTLSGSGDIISKDSIVTETFETSVSGSGDIILDIKAEATEARVTGSGDLTLTGSTNDLKASVTGSGDFHGFKLNANNTEAKVTGSGDVEVVSNAYLKARVTGSGDIEYKGNPKKEDSKVTGSGSIEN